jgi:hypothetical protein
VIQENYITPNCENWYCALLMSEGLTFGTIAALYGLIANIINTEQYSIIVAAVIAGAFVPALTANKLLLPGHLPEKPVLYDQLPDILKEKRKDIYF